MISKDPAQVISLIAPVFIKGEITPASNTRPPWIRNTVPADSNTPMPKLDANIARDQRNRDSLAALGWESLTLWECELKAMDGVLDRAASFLGPARVLPRGSTGQDPSQSTGVG